MSIAMAGQATALVDRWTSDPRSLGVFLSVVVPLAVVVGFLLLCGVSLAMLVYIVRAGFNGREMVSLRSDVDDLNVRVERAEGGSGP